MDERNVKWCNKCCEECGGWILYDLSEDVKFCEKCGLVVSAPYIHEVIE